jgi:hypothetical protein
MTEVNPLLEGLKLPGRIFQLPSRGIFYHNGELDENVKEGEVHVYPMSALDEINMKNPDQLFSGAAVNTVFTTCVKGVKKPSELLSKDVDAIMLFLRTVTYGASYEFMAHHGCGEFDGIKKPKNDYSYVADIEQLIGGMTMIDPTIVPTTYTVNLPNEQVVKLRPNKYQQVLDLIKANENKKVITVDDQQKNLIMMLLGVIESVNGVSDAAKIEEWIRKIPSPLVNRIAEKIEKINAWGSDLKWACKCKDCGNDYTVEIPINPVSFFTE